MKRIDPFGGQDATDSFDPPKRKVEGLLYRFSGIIG
jgi:hypothetical protein